MTIMTIIDAVGIMPMVYFGTFVLVTWMVTANRPNDVFSQQPTKWIDEETQQF